MSRFRLRWPASYLENSTPLIGGSSYGHGGQQLEAELPADPLIKELKGFLGAHNELIAELIIRAEQYANALNKNRGDHTLCHGDIHGWNLFIDDNGDIFIVDWDTMILAPKERDLMFIGCGLGGNGHSLEEETRLFYQGYGETEVNSIAVAYYRFERIIVDIVEFCKQICSLEENRDERIWALQTLQANFQLDNTVDLALRLDKLQNSLAFSFPDIESGKMAVCLLWLIIQFTT